MLDDVSSHSEMPPGIDIQASMNGVAGRQQREQEEGKPLTLARIGWRGHAERIAKIEYPRQESNL